MIKKVFLCFSGMLLASAVIAAPSNDDSAELYNKVFSYDSYKANFTQQILNGEQKVLQESKGQLQLARPNKFKMTVVEPDEAEIVADGTSIYNYDAMLEQVTIYDFSDQIVNSPLLLLISKDQKVWNSFKVVKKDNNSFEITPNDVSKGMISKMNISLKDGVFNALTVTEKDGKQNIYRFSDMNTDSIAEDSFKYIIPEGITVDDQRSTNL